MLATHEFTTCPRQRGFVVREAIRLCGFASEADAVTAASVAFHALRAHLAGRTSTPRDWSSDRNNRALMSVHTEKVGTIRAYCFELRLPFPLSEEEAVEAANSVEGAVDRWRASRTDSDDSAADRTATAAEPGERDDVYEDSVHSFPASDPPGWISMRLGPARRPPVAR
jgi:hypothetical protein